MHQYLHIGEGMDIPLYNLMIGIGAVFGFLFLEKDSQIHSLATRADRFFYPVLIVSLLCGFAGAKLAELLYHGQALSLENFQKAGFTFMGGLLSGAAVYLLLATVLRLPVFHSLELLVPFIIIAHAFGRMGCFLAGCCYGAPTHSFLGVVYPEDSLPARELGFGLALHPAQLYEAAFLFLLFYIIIRHISFGQRLPVYIIAYGAFRFAVEFLRSDDRGVLFYHIFSPSQWLSLLFITAGLLVFLFRMPKELMRSPGR